MQKDSRQIREKAYTANNMSGVVRIALAIALVIFVAGIIWAVFAARRDNKPVTQKPPTQNPPVITTPAPVVVPAPVVEAPAPAPAPAPVKTTPRRRAVQYIITYEEVSSEASASAWASAGTNADGSTWAEAHAE